MKQTNKQKLVGQALKELKRCHDKRAKHALRCMLRKLGHKGGLNQSCDERCWTAQKDKCTCECGGKNHGKHAVRVRNVAKRGDIDD